MALLLDSINTGLNIARTQQSRRDQEEARKQREVEALALQNWRNDQAINQARDDERAMKQAEALADWHKGETQRRTQEGIDRASDRVAVAEDRELTRKDREAIAKEKTDKAAKTAEFYARVGRNMNPAELSDMQAVDPGWQGPLPNTPRMGPTAAVADAMATQSGGVDPQVLERMITAEHAGRPQRQIPENPVIVDMNGMQMYLGANGWAPVPGQNIDRRNYETVKTTEPGTRNTTTKSVKRPEPAKPATAEEQAALKAMYDSRKKPEASQTPNAANNRQGGSAAVQTKPKDDEKIEMISPSGKRGLVPKSQRDQALKQGYKLP